jgi:hypothetical protein
MSLVLHCRDKKALFPTLDALDRLVKRPAAQLEHAVDYLPSGVMLDCS